MTRTCKNCHAKFEPRMPLQAVCGLECAKAIAPVLRAKLEKRKAATERKADRVKHDKLKSRADWSREAQYAFNAFIRLRDDGLPCISCGRHHGGQYHAGHYLSVGSHPELRFNELNVNRQCAPCNTHLSGNAVLYRKGLIDRIGLGGVEWLEGPQPQQHYSIDDLMAIKTKYSAKARTLKKELSA